MNAGEDACRNRTLFRGQETHSHAERNAEAASGQNDWPMTLKALHLQTNR
jgi:hypothetical protein